MGDFMSFNFSLAAPGHGWLIIKKEIYVMKVKVPFRYM